MGKPTAAAVLVAFALTSAAVTTTTTLDPGPASAAAGPTLTVNATSGVHPISPYIYGMAYAKAT